MLDMAGSDDEKKTFLKNLKMAKNFFEAAS